MKLHIFNPEHDLALAANIDNYTAPHAGRQLRHDLGYIPALWADEGDFVLVDDIDDAYEHIYNKVEFVTPLQLTEIFKNTMLVDSIHPWGWDKALVYQLRNLGCPEIMLPTHDSLEKVRNVSGRQWAAKHLQQDVLVVDNVNLLKDIITEKEKIVIKAPWSSSGRGVRYVALNKDIESKLVGGNDLEANLRWAANVIKQQGAVTVESYYNKVCDFGMEFEVMDGKVIYRGLSLFQTIKGAYTGNILATEEEKEELLCSQASSKIDNKGCACGRIDFFNMKDTLRKVREKIISTMQPVLHDFYSGAFGVDMMIYVDTQGCLQVNPCVELNLRRTMGHVALDMGLPTKLSRHIMKVDFDGNKYHLRVLPGRPSDNAPWH